jgi:hypothetical protein
MLSISHYGAVNSGNCSVRDRNCGKGRNGDEKILGGWGAHKKMGDVVNGMHITGNIYLRKLVTVLLEILCY